MAGLERNQDLKHSGYHDDTSVGGSAQIKVRWLNSRVSIDSRVHRSQRVFTVELSQTVALKECCADVELIQVLQEEELYTRTHTHCLGVEAAERG